MNKLSITIGYKPYSVEEAIRLLSDEAIDSRQYSDQTVADLRDVVQYLEQRAKVMARLYNLTINPPTNIEQVDELFRLKAWYNDEAQS